MSLSKTVILRFPSKIRLIFQKRYYFPTDIYVLNVCFYGIFKDIKSVEGVVSITA